MMSPTLIAMSGLPGSGKSAVAEGLAQELTFPILSVDPIESALWRAELTMGASGIAPYYVAETLAAENLRLGVSVIIDAVNPVEAARAMWRDLAMRASCHYVPIEVICSDVAIHRQRIEARRRDLPGIAEVNWERVQDRAAEYENWSEERLLLDSATETAAALTAKALQHIEQCCS